MPKVFLLALATMLLASCHGCKGGHPFVPYSIDGELADAGEGASLPIEAGDAPPLTEARAIAAVAGAKKWTLGGLDLTAPVGSSFVLGLVADLGEDGARMAVTLTRSDEAPTWGETWVYAPEAGGALGVSRVPTPNHPLEPSCTATPRLERVGAHAVMLELGETCGERAASAGRTGPGVGRWIGVIDLRKRPTVKGSLSVLDPEGAARLGVDAELKDLDHDGLDDLLLYVTLEGGGAPFEPGPKIGATLKWLDRPAGLSRQPDEPEASLHALAEAAALRASKPKDAPGVPILVRQARMLYVALCSEGRAPRLVRVLGDHPIQCGSSRALEELALAEARAYVTMNDPLRAEAALQLVVPPATRSAAKVAEVIASIEKIAPPQQATVLRAIAAVPLSERGRPPSWGALAFEPTGKLLVRTPAGVVRVDPALGDESEAGVVSWHPEVSSPDGGWRLLDDYDACDGFALRATLVKAGGTDVRDVLLPITPKIGPRCEGARGIAVRALPLGWGPLGLEAIVAGFPVLVASDLSRATPLDHPGSPWAPGSPRSPDGKSLVVSTPQGILTLGPKAHLLRAKELEGGYGELYDCAVSDDVARVACVRGGSAFVGIWPAP